MSVSVADGGRRSRCGFEVVFVVAFSEGANGAGFAFDFDFGLGLRGREYFVVMRVVVG